MTSSGMKDEVSLDELNIKEDIEANVEGPNGEGPLYAIDDVPPWYLSILMGFQQYLTMLTGIMTLPFILGPGLCTDDVSPARTYLFSFMLFSCGIVTILQAVVGVRLPIIQGCNYSFLIPVLNMLNLPEWKCPNMERIGFNVTDNFTNSTGDQKFLWTSEDEIWQHRMRIFQGSVMVASLLEVFLGVSGCVGAILHLITPLTITTTITLIGLSLVDVTVQLASKNWAIASGTVLLLLVFSQAMASVTLPIPTITKGRIAILARVPIFSLFPVLLAIIVMWSLCAILKAANVLTPESSTQGRAGVEHQPVWFSVPYPGQLGAPSIDLAVVIGLLAGITSSIIESIGDYYACARLSGASSPPVDAINRGIAIEGIGCVIGALLGNVIGSTSYSGNIAAIGITRVGSRRVILIAGALMMVLGVFTKFGEVFVSIPPPIVGGIFFVICGMIAATGLSNLQYVNLNSSRNLAVVGFAIFSGLAIPKLMIDNREIVNTGSRLADEVLFMLLSSNLFIGGVLGCVLDNVIPGSEKDRGIVAWRQQMPLSSSDENASFNTYDIPYLTVYVKKWRRWTRFLPFCPTFKLSNESHRHNTSS